MELASRSICTGCGACVKACPKGAIVFQTDEEGFPVPVILQENCVECGTCRRVCPSLYMPQTQKLRKAYAVQALDQEALKESTSGGMFTVLAREIFRRGGVVYGCIWDENYNAVIRRAEKEEEIIPMRGSKYVWSSTGDTYEEIRSLLESGRVVLFTGMPCQAAGLRSYLKKTYSNLYITAFFCGGAPSPFAFHEYLKTITRHVSLPQLNFKFRDKAKYGVGVYISYNQKDRRITQSYVRNPYFYSYHIKLLHRPSCYHCQYRYENRVDDLTFGDYWGVRAYHHEFTIRDGVSAVLVNTDQGEELLNAVKHQVRISETKPEYVAGWNNLTLGPDTVTFQPPSYRKAFFDQLKQKGWKSAEWKFLYRDPRLRLFLRESVPKSVLKIGKKLLRKK